MFLGLALPDPNSWKMYSKGVNADEGTQLLGVPRYYPVVCNVETSASIASLWSGKAEGI